MARISGEYLSKFGLSFIVNLTAADKISELAVKDWRTLTKKDFGILGISLIRFGLGVLSGGFASYTGAKIVENLLR